MDYHLSIDTPLRTVVRVLIISLSLLCVLLFIIFQARYLIVGPRIVLDEVITGPQNERQIFLTGTAFNISRLWLNDRQIYTDTEGHFNEALILENGYTIATLKAEDRYGRMTTVTSPLVYAPASFAQ
jgi:hypothetical protein